MTAAGSTSVWPFLIGRGLTYGYRVLLAPDFMTVTFDHAALEYAAGGSSSESPVVEQVRGRSEPLTVVSRRYRLAADLTHLVALSLGPDDRPPILLDEHGRPIEVLSGFVARGRSLASVALDGLGADLDRCDLAALETYARFAADEASYRVESSKSFDVTLVGDGRPSEVDEEATPPAEEDTGRPLDRRRRALIAWAVTTAGTVAIGILVSLVVFGVLEVGSERQEVSSGQVVRLASGA